MSNETFEVGRFMRGLKITKKPVSNVSEPYPMRVNYDARNAIGEVIAEINPSMSIFGANIADIPLFGRGEVLQEVREVWFDQVTYYCDLRRVLKKKGQEDGYKYGYKLVDPLTALLWVLQFKDELRFKHNSVMTLFCIDGRLHYLAANWILCGVDLAVSSSHVRQVLAGEDAREGQQANTRFLVVPATEDFDPMVGWPPEDIVSYSGYPERSMWVKFGHRVVNLTVRGLLSPLTLWSWLSARS